MSRSASPNRLTPSTTNVSASPGKIAIHGAFGIQILLGIATVMSGMNIVLAALHQAVGALVVAAFTWGAHVHGRAKA